MKLSKILKELAKPEDNNYAELQKYLTEKLYKNIDGPTSSEWNHPIFLKKMQAVTSKLDSLLGLENLPNPNSQINGKFAGLLDKLQGDINDGLTRTAAKENLGLLENLVYKIEDKKINFNNSAILKIEIDKANFNDCIAGSTNHLTNIVTSLSAEITESFYYEKLNFISKITEEFIQSNRDWDVHEQTIHILSELLNEVATEFNLSLPNDMYGNGRVGDDQKEAFKQYVEDAWNANNFTAYLASKTIDAMPSNEDLMREAEEICSPALMKLYEWCKVKDIDNPLIFNNETGQYFKDYKQIIEFEIIRKLTNQKMIEDSIFETGIKVGNNAIIRGNDGFYTYNVNDVKYKLFLDTKLFQGLHYNGINLEDYIYKQLANELKNYNKQLLSISVEENQINSSSLLKNLAKNQGFVVDKEQNLIEDSKEILTNIITNIDDTYADALDLAARVKKISHQIKLSSDEAKYLSDIFAGSSIADAVNNMDTTDIKNHKNFFKTLEKDNININQNIDSKDNEGNTALIIASRSGLKEAIQFLLEKEANVNAANQKGWTALMFAANNDDIEIVELLLANDRIDPNKASENCCEKKCKPTALKIAVRNNNIDIIKLLLEKEADVNTTAENACGALMIAAANGSIDIVKLLLEKGVDVNAEAENGCTALMIAAGKNNIEIVKLLLESGANVNAAAENGWTACMFAADNGDIEIVKFLLQKEEDVDAVKLLLNKRELELKTQDIENIIQISWRKGYIELLKLLLDEFPEQFFKNIKIDPVLIIKDCLGTNVNATAKNGLTALMFVVKNGNIEMVKSFLEKEANVNAVAENGWTALMFAANRDTDFSNEWFTAKAKNNNIEIVKLLLEKGANINAVSINSGNTALMLAAKNNNIEIVKLLLEKEANINAVNKNGKTALIVANEEYNTEISKIIEDYLARQADEQKEFLHTLIIAAKENNIEVVKLLLEKEVDLNAIDKNGEIALIVATKENNIEVVNLLLEKGANINATDQGGWTALTIASFYREKIEMVKLLLAKGANVNAVDENGEIALIVATKENNIEVVKLLLEKGANVNATDQWGSTALTIASFYREKIEMVKLLLAKGANINAVNKNGKTALIVANEEYNTEISKIIEDYLAKKAAHHEEILESQNINKDLVEYHHADTVNFIGSKGDIYEDIS